MSIGFHVKCWLFLLDLNMTWIFFTFLKSLQIPYMKIHPVGAALFHVGRQTWQNKWLLFALLWTCWIVTGLCARWQESVGFPTGRGFSLFQSVRTGCVVQPASCSMCTCGTITFLASISWEGEECMELVHRFQICLYEVYKDNFHYWSCHPLCVRWHIEQHLATQFSLFSVILVVEATVWFNIWRVKVTFFKLLRNFR